MLNFFRTLRKKLIMPDNVQKYLFYAIGEILLVVIGILIALQVNNWNESRRADVERDQLFKSLKDEMLTTVTRMDTAIVEAENFILNGQKLLRYLPEFADQTPLDSIRTWTSGILDLHSAEPQLTSYNEAVSSGRIGLLRNKIILEEYTQLLLSYERYKRHINIGAEMYYLGPFWEIKKEIGDIQVISPFIGKSYSPQVGLSYEMDAASFRAYVSKPIFHAAIQNILVLHNNIYSSYQGIRTHALEIIEEINRIGGD